MTTLREAAQQALEAWDAGDTEWFKRAYTVMEALKAALAEPSTLDEAMAGPRALAQAYENGWNAAKATGDNLSPTEPVAWIHTDPDKPRVKFLEWREDEPGYRGRWFKTPLFTAPPQRLPLTEEEITRCWERMGRGLDKYTAFARNVERAHGITS